VEKTKAAELPSSELATLTGYKWRDLCYAYDKVLALLSQHVPVCSIPAFFPLL
jgi:hypothetical protein